VAIRIDRAIQRAAINPTVIADKDVLLAADGANRDRVLVGVGCLWAAIRTAGTIRRVEDVLVPA
jgi:hypothetical protein